MLEIKAPGCACETVDHTMEDASGEKWGCFYRDLQKGDGRDHVFLKTNDRAQKTSWTLS